jgi:hypothetical protein
MNKNEYMRMLTDLWYVIDYSVSVINHIRWLLNEQGSTKEAEDLQKIIESFDDILVKLWDIIKIIGEAKI